MELKDKVVVITGGASGIGAALARRFAQEGPKALAIVDRNEAGAQAVAAEVGGVAYGADLRDEHAVEALIDQIESAQGPIDLFCSNAGIGLGRGIDTSTEDWRTIIDINLMAHVFAARTLVPRMVARGGGYLLNTASAAGLLSQIGSVTYAVTKHAAVSLAEWLSITHGDEGLKVSVLCPQAVDTPMIAGTEQGGVAGVDGIMAPETVADVVVEGIRE